MNYGSILSHCLCAALFSLLAAGIAAAQQKKFGEDVFPAQVFPQWF